MTNSVLGKRKSETGTTRITQETDKRFVSKRGTEFIIDRKSSGLFFIHMKKGGKPPRICDELYTSYNKAEFDLIRYLTKRDPLRWAIFPGSEKTYGVKR